MYTSPPKNHGLSLLGVDFLDEAISEADRARRVPPPESDLARRQAAEKIWGYVASELNRELRAAGLQVEPGSGGHDDRRRWLRELDRALGRNLTARHDAYADLHGACFYDSRCPPPEVLKALAREAREFVEEAKQALLEVRRRGARA